MEIDSRECFKKLRDGVRLDDFELKHLYEKLDGLIKLSMELGTEFDMVVAFCIPKRDAIESYIHNRRDKK